MDILTQQTVFQDTPRVETLRRRVREAMKVLPVTWACPAQIDAAYMAAPLAVRKARAIALKLAHMPTDLWADQLFAGSMTLESPPDSEDSSRLIRSFSSLPGLK